MKKTTFPSPQDAESAFYEALQGADLDAMMEVWADDEEIVCVHPGGERLVGYDAVRSGWAAIASSGRRLRVQQSDLTVVSGMMVTVHSLQEHISVQGQGGGAGCGRRHQHLSAYRQWLAHDCSSCFGTAPGQPAFATGAWRPQGPALRVR